MNTTAKQLAADLQALQHGYSWLGYDATEILKGIDESIASKRAFAQGNSIWQIVNHISFWRGVVLRRINGAGEEEPDATGMDEPAIKDSSEWKRTIQNFENSYQALKKAIEALDDVALYRPVNGGRSLYFHVNGCIQHDAFHLGQIMMVKRMAEEGVI